MGSKLAVQATAAPPSIDKPSQRGGFVVKEHARLVILWRLPHATLGPTLEAIVTGAIAVAGDLPLAYPRPSGDWMDPKPRAKITSHVRAIAKQPSNATLSLSSLDDDDTFALEYRAYLPVWIEGRVAARAGAPTPRRGKASYLQVTFPRATLYERPDAMLAWMRSLLALAPFSAATLGLALEGHYAEQYPLALEHLALDISDVGCVTDDVGDDLHGIGWLTALGPELTRRVGGAKALTPTLGDEGAVVAEGAAVIVRLGERPTRGSTESELTPYRTLARAVGAALHVPRETSYFTCGFADGSDAYRGRDALMQETWHRRFVLPRDECERPFRPNETA